MERDNPFKRIVPFFAYGADKMDEKKKKMWSSPLNAKTSRYYAIVHFTNSEKTWNAYFKAMKSIDSLVSCISNKKFDNRNIRKLVSIGNEIGESFSNEATTRMVFAMIQNECFSDAKTLLEWLGLYWKHPIPEANLEQVPQSTQLAETLKFFKGKKH